MLDYYKELEKIDFSKDICIDSFKLVDDAEIGEVHQIANDYRFTDGKQIEPLIRTKEFCTLLLEQDGFQALVEDENGSFLTATIEKTELEICIESLLEINKDKKVQDACQIIKDILQKEKEIDLLAFSFRKNDTKI